MSDLSIKALEDSLPPGERAEGLPYPPSLFDHAPSNLYLSERDKLFQQYGLTLQDFSVLHDASDAGRKLVFEAHIKGKWGDQGHFHLLGEHESEVLAVLEALAKGRASVRAQLDILLKRVLVTGLVSNHPMGQRAVMSAYAFWRSAEGEELDSYSRSDCQDVVEASLDLLRQFDEDHRDNDPVPVQE